MKNISQKQVRLIVFFIALALFIYAFLRAYILSFTFDESWSFLNIYHYKFWTLGHSNTHPINSILMLFAYKLFSNNEFFLRMPNLLAYVIFMFFSFKILSRFKPVFLIFGFIFLNFNPFMVDFFSLARGYGLSLAFLMCSLYFLLKDIENPDFRNKSIFLSTFFASLSVFSNYTVMYYYLSLIVVILLTFLINKKVKKLYDFKRLLNNFKYTLIYNVLFLVLVLGLLIRLQHKGQLFFGGTTGLLKDTFFSLIKSTWYFKKYPHIILYLILVFILGVMILGIYFSIAYFKDKNKLDGKSALLIILILCILGPYALNIFFNTLFPIERTALFYLPLFSLIFVFLIQNIYLNNKKTYRSIAVVTLVVVSLISVIHFIRVMNLHYCYSWRYDANTKNVFKTLSISNPQRDKKNMGISWVFTKSSEYYKLKNNLDWLEIELIDKPWQYIFELPELSQTYYRKKFHFEESSSFNLRTLANLDYLYVIKYKNIDFTEVATKELISFNEGNVARFLKINEGK